MAENTVGMAVGYAVESLFQINCWKLHERAVRLAVQSAVSEAVGPAVRKVPIGSTVVAIGLAVDEIVALANKVRAVIGNETDLHQ